MSTTETPSTLHCWLPSGTGPSLCSGLVNLCQTTVKGTPSRTEAHSTDKHSWPVPVPLLSQWPHCSWALWEWNGSRGGVAVRLCTAAFLQWCCLQPDGLPHLLQVGLHSPLYIFVIQELWPDRTVVQKTVWYHEPGADPQRFVILAFLSAQWRCYIFPMTLLANTQVYWFWNTSVSLFLFSPCLPSRMNMCPNNCSGRGECRVGPSGGQVYCECEDSWKGEACDTPYCQTQCGSPDRGHCQNKTCVCKTGWQGELVVLLFLLLLLWGCDWFSRLASAASILFLCSVSEQEPSGLMKNIGSSLFLFYCRVVIVRFWFLPRSRLFCTNSCQLLLLGQGGVHWAWTGQSLPQGRGGSGSHVGGGRLRLQHLRLSDGQSVSALLCEGLTDRTRRLNIARRRKNHLTLLGQ